jgi:hypothetical protein
MKKLTIAIFLLLLFLACKKGTDSAGLQEELISQPGGSNQVTRPFTANLYSSIDPDPSIPPTPCSGDLPGFANPGHFLHGQASHLGELIWQQSRLQDVSCNLNFATAQLTTSIAGQFAAANGDLVYYTGNDVFDITNFLTGGGPTGTLNGTWTITGGTGRFTGATGSFTITGTVDFTTLTFSFNAVGTITY